MPQRAPQSPAPEPRDAAYWAQLATATLTVRDVPPGAINLNVEGHAVYGPLQGFGALWRKTFRVRLAHQPQLAPAAVVRVWKAEFPRFWPRSQHFYASPAGIVPGEVALINGRVGGLPMDTGMLVLYADDESFTLMTPRGHVFASWITFSAGEDEQGTYAQVQMLLRAGDPIYAAIMRLGGFRYEDGVWHHTLRALAAYLGVDGHVEQEIVCLDPHLQWGYVTNVWYNAGFRSFWYAVAAPLRGLRRAFGRTRSTTAGSPHVAPATKEAARAPVGDE